MTRICPDCNGSGRDDAGHNFAYTGPAYACESCDGLGSWEEDTLAELRAGELDLTDVQPLPDKLNRRAASMITDEQVAQQLSEIGCPYEFGDYRARIWLDGYHKCVADELAKLKRDLAA